MTQDAITLSQAAAFERDTRAKHYPAMVARSEMPAAEAKQDLDEWSRIAVWLETGQLPLDPKVQAWERRAVWRPLERVARSALERREAAASEKPDSAALAKRLRNVAAIHFMLARNADAFEPAQ